MTQRDNMYTATHIFYITDSRRDRGDRGDILKIEMQKSSANGFDCMQPCRSELVNFPTFIHSTQGQHI